MEYFFSVSSIHVISTKFNIEVGKTVCFELFGDSNVIYDFVAAGNTCISVASTHDSLEGGGCSSYHNCKGRMRKYENEMNESTKSNYQ